MCVCVCVCVCVRVSWNVGQKVFFDIRVFNPNASTYGNTDVEKSYEMNEREKKRQYNERIIEVGRDTFTSLVLSANGSFGKERT